MCVAEARIGGRSCRLRCLRTLLSVSTRGHSCSRGALCLREACGDSLIVPEQLPVCCKELFRLASSGAYVVKALRSQFRRHVSVCLCVCVCYVRGL